MDFYVYRAMDIARLNFGQIRTLHEREQEIGRCLVPADIRVKFRLQSIKEFWGIPAEGQFGKLASAQEYHAHRIAQEIAKAGCLKDNGGPVESDNVPGTEWPVHLYDMKIFYAVGNEKINFKYKPLAKKSSLLDEVEEDEPPVRLAVL